ncbi:MAG: phosphoribosyltransferase family protein [Bacteroidota bacterium]
MLSSEKMICTACRHILPVTNFHRYNDPYIKKLLYARLKLEQATALFFFEKKGAVQQLMHNLKYKGDERISGFLGQWLGFELSETKEYQNIDIVIPVPIHPRKKRKRGYNQVTGFGKALAEYLNCDFSEKILVKSKNTKTQVFKGRFTRSDAVYEAFSVSNYEKLNGSHILLVDDILTTGSTLEACGLELLKIPNIKLSIAVMAIAKT